MSNRATVFIDGAYLTKILDVDFGKPKIDLARFSDILCGKYERLRTYYYNCMPCHGDQGQGLTDEFREIWVEDHQNCWAVGCHGGRTSDEGFPIPRTVPPVTGIRVSLQSAEYLFKYLKETHPPQRPGVLEENDYWDLTGWILYKNGLQAADAYAGPAHIQINPWLAGLVFLILLSVISISLIIQSKHPSWIGYNTKD